MENNLIEEWRIITKYSSIAGQEPTIPLTDDHMDGTWLTTDLYVGEIFLNTIDNKAWFRSEGGIVPLGGSGSGTYSFIGDYVHISGGTFSGVVYAPTFSANGITASYIIADTYNGGTFNGVFVGDGSGLTGINADWLGGTVSNPSQFLNEFTLTNNTFLDGVISSNNSAITYNKNINITSGAGVSASFFIGDGSGLTNLPVGTYSDIYTLGATISGYTINFERNNSTTYNVDLTPMFGTNSNVSGTYWNGTTNELELTFYDGTSIVTPIDTFNNLSLFGSLNATDVYANNFYGTFNGTYSNDIYTIGATLSGTNAIFTRTDGVTYSLNLSSLVSTGATPSLMSVLAAGNDSGTHNIIMGTYTIIESSNSSGRIEMDHDDTGVLIKTENNLGSYLDTAYITNDNGANLGLEAVDTDGLNAGVTVNKTQTVISVTDPTAGLYTSSSQTSTGIDNKAVGSTPGNQSRLTMDQYETIMKTSITDVDNMDAYQRNWANPSQIGSQLRAFNNTLGYSSTIEAQYDGSHIQNILTATDGTETTFISQRHYEMVVSGSLASFKGIEYLNDYSTNYSSRSLVDKQYADSVATLAVYGNDARMTAKTTPYRLNGNSTKIYKFTHDVTGTATTTINLVAERVTAQVFYANPGEKINEIAFRITTAGVAGTGLAQARILIYRAKLDANGYYTGGDLELDTAVNISTLTTGLKVVSGLNHTLSSNTYKNVWFMAIRNYQSNVLTIRGFQNTAAITGYGDLSVATTTSYRDLGWVWQALSTDPTPASMPVVSSGGTSPTAVNEYQFVMAIGYSHI